MTIGTVYFEETGEERHVTHTCLRCERIGGSFNGVHGVVSPWGMLHHGVDYGRTACGINADGPAWWWPL